MTLRLPRYEAKCVQRSSSRQTEAVHDVYSITTVNSITSTIPVVTMKTWSVSLNLEVFTHNLGSSFANERTIFYCRSWFVCSEARVSRVSKRNTNIMAT